MRVSTSTIYDAGVTAMNKQQAQLLKTQQQIAANRRVLTPSDDPIASARALEISQADAINTQYGTNSKTASGQLALTEQALGRVNDLLQSVRDNVIASGNGSFTVKDRASVAADVQALYQELLTVSNTTDGEGNYLFSGYQSNVQPFSQGAAGVQYQGDDGQRLVQVASGRQIAVSESGADVFTRIRQGNGSFNVSAPATNAGNVTYTPGSVTNQAALTGHRYQITFTVAAGVTTYDVIDNGPPVPTVPPFVPTTVLAAQPYTSGSAIAFDGMTFQVSGTPASGDQLNLDPSANQDMFKTLSNLVTVLQSPGSGPAGNAQLQNALTDALSNLDLAIDNVGTIRAGVGTRMREVDNHESASEDLSVQYKQSLSQLQDLDYAKAISDLMQQQTNLQASQKTFLQTANLSIFNYI